MENPKDSRNHIGNMAKIMANHQIAVPMVNKKQTNGRFQESLLPDGFLGHVLGEVVTWSGRELAGK